MSLLQSWPGPTWDIIGKLGAKRGKLHLELMLRRWSHHTVLRHARNFTAFENWANMRYDNQFLIDVRPKTKEEAVLMLVEYVHHLVDADVEPTVPKNRLASLRFFASIANVEHKFPVDDVAVTTVAVLRASSTMMQHDIISYSIV